MKFSMRPSRVLKKLRAGEPAKMMKINISDTRVIEIAARYGFDCLWIGMEHIGNDWSVIEKQVLAAKAYDVDVLCRVARGSYSDYVRPLELDATGIMVPHVMSAEDAASVVRMTKFPPVGKRAVDGGNADGAYCNVPFLEYLEQANKERFVVLQIEDPEAVEELDEIAAVPGYDMLLFGAGDYSVAIGKPGQVDDPGGGRRTEEGGPGGQEAWKVCRCGKRSAEHAEVYGYGILIFKSWRGCCRTESVFSVHSPGLRD